MQAFAPPALGMFCAASTFEGVLPSSDPQVGISYVAHIPQLVAMFAVTNNFSIVAQSAETIPPFAGKMGLDRGMQAVVTAIVFTALAFVFIVLRCISRFWVIHQAGTEDYLIIFALVLSIGTTVTIFLGTLLNPPDQELSQLTLPSQKRTMAWVAT